MLQGLKLAAIRGKIRRVFKVRSFRRFISGFLAASIFVVTGLAAEARGNKQQDDGPNLIRDAEIEGLLRQFSKPIFKAAHIDPDAVKVYVIANDSINAFVAGGQRIFINTGLFTKTRSYTEVIGVLAHETGHIAGGHLARMQNELDQASTERIIGMLVGVAAAVGGSAAGVQGAAGAGQGLIVGSQGLSQRRLLSYQRSMESSADQAAIKYLNATGQDPKGMLTLFNKLANDSFASTANADPYLFSHPMPMERIRNLEVSVKKSPYYAKPENDGLKLRYELVKAKIVGYMQSPQRVFQRYPSTDHSMASRYARSVALYRRGDITNALPLLDSLIDELPENPYFWELKAQALLESGQAERGLPFIEKARALLPKSGLLQILHAQLLLGTGGKVNAGKAMKLLVLAKQSEGNSPIIFKNLAEAHAASGDIARAELATAEYAYSSGDKSLAVEKAKAAQQRFKRGTPEWLRANDILTFASRKN
jgi:predicted Zn-dependent protease